MRDNDDLDAVFGDAPPLTNLRLPKQQRLRLHRLQQHLNEERD